MTDRAQAVSFRLVKPGERRGIFRVDSPLYEVSAGSQVVRAVSSDQLRTALGMKPNASMRDLHECEMVASRLYSQGRFDEWVDYPTGQVLEEPDQAG